MVEVGSPASQGRQVTSLEKREVGQQKPLCLFTVDTEQPGWEMGICQMAWGPWHPPGVWRG